MFTCLRTPFTQIRILKMRAHLKAARIHAGYSQHQMAILLGVSQQTVSKYEKAAITPGHFRIIREYEKVLGVRAEELFPDIFADKSSITTVTQ